MSHHEIELLGRLGNAPELRHTASGAPVANFSVATSRHLTSPDGTRSEETIWWKVSAWNKQAENAAKYLVKGQQVFVKGRLKVDPQTNKPNLWTDQQSGEVRVNLEVVANSVIYLAKPTQNQTTVHVGQRGHYNQNQPQAAPPPRQRRTTDPAATYSPQQQQPRRRSQPQQYSRSQPSTRQQSRIEVIPQDNFGPDEIPF